LPHPSKHRTGARVNIRPATHDDDGFLRKMLYEAAAWNPDWLKDRMIEALADPVLERYHRDWGRQGDAGVIAELDGEPVGAAWYRLFTSDEPGYGFVDEKTPELGIAVVPLHRRRGIGETLLRALMVQAREDGFHALSLSVAVHNRSRMMYERVGFARIREDDEGETWVMRADLD
jgi:ribosomal protein S18 acetylase RimI-like enzyme